MTDIKEGQFAKINIGDNHWEVKLPAVFKQSEADKLCKIIQLLVNKDDFSNRTIDETIGKEKIEKVVELETVELVGTIASNDKSVADIGYTRDGVVKVKSEKLNDLSEDNAIEKRALELLVDKKTSVTGAREILIIEFGIENTPSYWSLNKLKKENLEEKKDATQTNSEVADIIYDTLSVKASLGMNVRIDLTMRFGEKAIPAVPTLRDWRNSILKGTCLRETFQEKYKNWQKKINRLKHRKSSLEVYEKAYPSRIQWIKEQLKNGLSCEKIAFASVDKFGEEGQIKWSTLYEWRAIWRLNGEEFPDLAAFGNKPKKISEKPSNLGKTSKIEEEPKTSDVIRFEGIYNLAKGRILSGATNEGVIVAVKERFNYGLEESRLEAWREQIKRGK